MCYIIILHFNNLISIYFSYTSLTQPFGSHSLGKYGFKSKVWHDYPNVAEKIKEIYKNDEPPENECWIGFDDELLSYFDCLFQCQIYDNTWKLKIKKHSWNKYSAGGCPK